MIGMVLDVSIRVSLVAASVAVILLAARVRSSSVRHGAWTAALGAMLLMPVLPRVVPTIDVPLRVTSSAFDVPLRVTSSAFDVLPDFSAPEGADRALQLSAADEERMNRLLKDAASVRAGVMPMSYQYAVARGE